MRLGPGPFQMWSGFPDEVGLVVAHVPALLVAHHIVRHGGIGQMSCQTVLRKTTVMVDLHLEVPAEYQEFLDSLIAELKDAHLMAQ